MESSLLDLRCEETFWWLGNERRGEGRSIYTCWARGEREGEKEDQKRREEITREGKRGEGGNGREGRETREERRGKKDEGRKTREEGERERKRERNERK